jgi:transposase-like protein
MSVTCPFCRAESAQLISLFGSQLLLSQYRCAACGSYFEGLRGDLGSGSWDLGETTTTELPQILDPKSQIPEGDTT